MKKQGSALLIIVLTLSVVGIVVTTVWRGTILSFEAALEQENRERHRWLAEGALQHGIFYAKKNYQELIAAGQQQSLYFDRWLLPSYSAAVTLDIQDGSILMKATVYSHNKKTTVYSLTCVLSQEQNNSEKEDINQEINLINTKYAISQWHIS